MENGEQLILEECFTIECDISGGLSVDHRSSWGCEGTTCDPSNTITGTVSAPSAAPNLGLDITVDDHEICFDGSDEGVLRVRLTNNGSEPALINQMRYNSGGGGTAITSMQFFQNTTELTLGDIFSDEDSNSGSGCGVGSSQSTFSNDVMEMPHLSLAPGDSIILEMGYVRCCPSECGSFSLSRPSIRVWALNSCGVNSRNWPGNGGIDGSASVSAPIASGPAQIPGGENGTICIEYPSHSFLDLFEGEDQNVIFNVALPDGLTYDDLSMVAGYNGIPFSGASVTPNGSFDQVSVTVPLSEIDMAGSHPLSFCFDVSADCAGSGGDIEYSIGQTLDSDCDPVCAAELSCETYEVLIPACECDAGGTFFSTNIQRVSFGFEDTDDNRDWESFTRADSSDVDLTRVIVGDTVRSQASIGFMGGSTWDQVIYRESFPNDAVWCFDTAWVIVKDNIGNSVNIGNITPSSSTGGNFEYDLSPDGLGIAGAYAAAYDDADTLLFRAKYEFCKEENEDWYSLNGDTESNNVYEDILVQHNVEVTEVGGTESLECDFDANRLTLLGSALSVDFVSNDAMGSGCDRNFRYRIDVRQNIGGIASGPGANYDFFPNEFRPLYFPDSIAIQMQPNVNYDTAWLRVQQWTDGGTNTMTTGLVPTMIVDSVIYFDIESIHNAFGGDFSFEEENATIQYYIEFMRTCGSNSQLMTDLSISYRTPLCPDSLFVQRDETAQAGGGANLGNISFNPSSSAVIEVAHENTCFDLSVRPQGGNLAFTWLEILNPEDVDIVSVSTGGSPLSLENGIYLAGTHNNNNQKTFEICANLLSCSETEVQVVFGWDCYGYPSDAAHEEACSYDTVTYILSPVESTIMMELTQQPAVGPGDYPDLCDELLYELRVNSSGAGAIIDPSITASLPVGFVVDYVEVEYMGNTETVSHSTMGSSLIANIYDHSLLEHDSLPGLLTSTNVPNRQALMRFYGQTNCDFRSGSRIRFELSADRPCGGPATGNGSTVESERLRLEGLNPYITDPVLFSELEGALSCGATTSVNVSFEVTEGDFTGQDSAIVILPPGVNFVESSINCDNSMICPEFDRIEDDGLGGSRVYFGYPSVSEGTTIEYSFDIILDNSFACGSTVEVGLENFTIVDGELDCGATTCDGPHTVVTGGNNVIYQVENTELMFTSFAALNPAGTNEVLYEGELEVSQVAVTALDTFQVVFYCADAMGEPTGPSLGSTLFTGPAEIGETVAFSGSVPGDCVSGEIVGVVNAVNNCICAEVQTFTEIEEIEPDFDLALSKQIQNVGPYNQGDTLVFNIQLYNQGNVSADSIVVQDYIPAGELEYIAIGDSTKTTSSGLPVTISDVGAGAYAIDSLVAGDTLLFNISLRVSPDFMGTSIRNWAEISYATNALGEPDSDSTPDDENFNQPGESDDLDDDNIVDEDGMDGGDEDDHDPAEIEVEQIFDLALKKELATDPLMVFPGAEVDFTITVYNQNGLSADSISIMDYLMTDSLLYTTTGDQTVASADGVSTQIVDYGDGTYGIDTLAAFDTLEFNITLQVDELFTGDSITNYAEIMYSSNVLDAEDIDSEPDSDRFNDAGGEPESDADNFVDGDGSSTPGGGDSATDEDDHDPAKFEVLKTFDLALKKIIKPGTLPVDGFTWGDTVHFEVTVFNQGFISADSIVIQDYIPADPNMPGSTDSVLQQVGDLSASIMSSVNSTPIELVGNGDGTFSLDTLPLLDSATFDVSYRINENFRGLSAINNAEIILGTNVPGLEDEDSTPGDNEMTEAELSTDNDVDDDGPGTPGTEDNPDESDDYDPAEFNMSPRFDLALSKVIADTLSSPLNYGDTIVFGINVVNEGNVAATSFEVTDSIPSGFAYIASNDGEGWAFDGSNMASRTITGPIEDYGDTTILIELVLVQDYEADAYLNTAEITDDENDLDEEDEDSTPDNEDPEEDDIEQRQVNIADLALRKVLSSTTSGPFNYGDTLAMEIEVYNQGNVPVDSIEVTDYLPEGLTYIDDAALNPGWDGTDPLNPVYAWSGDTLYQTESDTITLYVTLSMVAASDSASWTNYSEISYARDTSGMELEDIDSEADGDPSNDTGGTPDSDEDDHVADDGMDTDQDGITDEDDHDPVYIPVYDLALQKTINPGFVAPYRYGDTITMDIRVVNQGNEAANTIEVTDYIPDGLEFAPGKNADWDTTGTYPVYTIMDTLAAGEDTVVGLEVVVVHGTSMESWTNYAEISSALDSEGNLLEDIDSEADEDPENDYGAIPEGGTDDALDGDGSQSGEATEDDEPEYDEDDMDVEQVRVVDLALYKQVDTSLSIFPEMFGSTIKFDIILVNQGNVVSDSIVVEDYLPDGYGFDPMDPNNIAEGWGSDLTITQQGRLQFGESDTVCLYTTLENVTVPMEDSWWNYAEITEVYDTTGMEIGGDDMDSEPGSDSEEERSVDLESDGDDDINSTGREDTGSDDDHDVAGVRFLDLALYKQVDSTVTTFPVAYGDLIKFDLIAVNQEGVAVDSIRVRDYVPEGYSFDANIPENAALGWQADTTSVIAGPFEVGDTMHTSIYLTLEQISVPTDRSWVNYSEIANAWMGDMDIAGMDIDSEPGSDSPEEREVYPGLDGDDDIESIDRDSTGSEDDHDPAHVEVFDLALRKTTNATVGKVGDDITFTIDIYNQGSIAATDIEISDYVNDGYDFNGFLNPDWQNTNNTVTTVLEDTLYAGESTSVQLVLTVTNAYDPDAMINRAEISMATDTSGMEREDIDGMFDQDEFNDPGGLSESPADDYVDGDGTGNINDGNPDGDEDNADPEYVIPCPPVNCYGSLFLSFDRNCEIVVTPDMLLIENGLARKNPEFYDIEMTYGNGIVIPENTLYKEHVGKEITARITFLLDECGGGACETTIRIEKPDGCLIGNTLDTMVYCVDPFLELDPEDDAYPKPEAMQPCEEDPLTVRPGVDWVDTDFECTSDTAKVIYREWMAETRSGERCTASDTIVVLRLPALTGNEFVEMKEDSFYCELTPMSMMDPYSVDYNAWKQPIGIHDYEQPGSGLRGVIYDLPVLVMETALAGAQTLGLEDEYLDQEVLRKKNGVVYRVEDFMPGGDYYSVLENLGGERGQLLELHRGPFNFVDYPFIVLELGDWILGSGGYFEQVTEEWFYSGNANSPFWFAGAWPFMSGGGECIKYMDGSEAEGENCLAHIQLPAIEVVDGELVYNTEECVELCLKEGIHCGLSIEGADFGAWEGQCPQTRGRNVTVTQTCWSDAPNCDAGIYQDGGNDNSAVTSVDSTGKRIVVELEKWQTIIDTIGPIFEFCYDIEADHDVIQSDIRSGVMPAIADEWEQANFTTYSTGSHDCAAEVYVPKVVLKDSCSGIHHVKATVNGKSVLLQGGIPDEDGYRVFNHITDPIDIPFEGHDAPLREIVYEAVDSCWNVSTWTKYLKVKDETVPHVVTDDMLRVPLNNKEEWVEATAFDEGSYDNCGIELELARRTDWWQDPKCVNLCPEGETFGNWADILVAIGFDRRDVNVVLSGGTLNGSYDLDLEQLKENILDDTKIEEHYFKSIAWLWEDSDCPDGALCAGEKVVHGWLYEIATVLGDPAYCGPESSGDEHGNPLSNEVLREFFDRLTGVPGYGKEIAYMGGGWSTDVPFKCEDACKEVTVEYMAVDYWCNWSKGWLPVEVEDKSKGEVARELEDLSITCESYSANYEGIVLAALEAGNSTNDPEAFAALDSIWGRYIPTWLDNQGRAVDAEGALLSNSELTFEYTNLSCGEKSETIKIADTLHDGTIDWIQRVEKVVTLKEERETGYHGIIGILCSGEVEQDVWVDLDDCNQGVITRRFRIKSCSDKSPVLELEQKIYIESACGLRKSMFHVPESLEKEGVCVASLEYDGKGNVVLPSGTGSLTLRDSLDGVLCNGITVGYEDKVYKIAEAGDQYKVERNWTAADWCTHEELTFTQVIKVTEDADCAQVVDSSDQDIVYAIKGNIYTEAEEMLSNVSVTAQVDSGSAVTTRTQGGEYSFRMEEGTEVDIVPYKNDDHREGLSTLDVVEIWQHIMERKELEGWTSQMAADVDHNGMIDVHDVMELRKLVLTPGAQLANSPSWRFIHRETDREHYRINGLSKDMEIDFMGVKIGDVNVGEDPSRRKDRSGLDALVLQTGDRYLEAGGSYRIDVTSSNYTAITGGQLSLEYLSQWVGIQSIESGALNIGENGQVKVRPGLLHVNWIDGAAQSFGKEEVLFTIVLEAKADGWLRDMVHVGNSSIPSEAYGADRSLKNIGIHFSDAMAGYALYQNAPNPFEGETTIGFHIPKKDDVILNIYDVTGRLIKVVEGEYESGLHKVRLRLDEISNGGVMYYQFRSGDYTETKQMILIR